MSIVTFLIWLYRNCGYRKNIFKISNYQNILQYSKPVSSGTDTLSIGNQIILKQSFAITISVALIVFLND